jgi:NADH:ubiquinone oxidoreductase subunit F (NADH-binding)
MTPGTPSADSPAHRDPGFERGPETESFYHLTGVDLGQRPCAGTACFVARNSLRQPQPQCRPGEPRVYCLGRCFAAPATGLSRARPRIEVHSREAIVLGRLAENIGPSLADYEAAGGGGALLRALQRPPSDIVDAVASSALRGRGGAGFPAGRKWAAVRAAASPDEKFVVANADEGDPGAYIDRFIMEGDPHALIEGMTLAAYAVGASHGWVYLRYEYPYAKEVLDVALAEARAENRLGREILGTNFDFDIEVMVGRGSYVCGEETALLRSIEGRRPEAVTRPPYAAESGLFQRPTLLNNVESFATVPWIVQHGGDAYRRFGFSQSFGTKALSLNSLFVRPGLYEVEFGIPVRQIVEEIGGGMRAGKLTGVIIGGPLAGIIPPSLLDTPLGFEELRAIGASVGHGGVVAFDEATSIAALARHVFSFGAYESCGKCAPCRLGSRRLEQIFTQIASGVNDGVDRSAEMENLVTALRWASLCGHGVGLGEFAESALRHYGKELAGCWK